jgi:hypothetical protein
MDDITVFSPVDASGHPIEKGPGQGLPILDQWNPRPATLAREMVRRHGRPSEITSSRVIWTDAHPFKRIVVLKDEIVHEFPKEHYDCLEHAVSYRVPLEAVYRLYEFSTAIVVDRHAEELIVRCVSERMNILHLNIAHFMVSEGWNAVKAQVKLISELENIENGLESELSERVLFTTE